MDDFAPSCGREDRFVLPACPLLPSVGGRLGPETTRSWSGTKCRRFYLAALHYAQSLWREGKPAQAILQLNKAFMADLVAADAPVLVRHPPPYAALVWILRHRPHDRFLGNPVRHFQHLATRISGERREIRAWRAWACFHLARGILPAAEFPVDAAQVTADHLVFPTREETLGRIAAGGWSGEAAVLAAAVADLR
jgi:hypothetical protein